MSGLRGPSYLFDRQAFELLDPPGHNADRPAAVAVQPVLGNNLAGKSSHHLAAIDACRQASLWDSSSSVLSAQHMSDSMRSYFHALRISGKAAHGFVAAPSTSSSRCCFAQTTAAHVRFLKSWSEQRVFAGCIHAALLPSRKVAKFCMAIQQPPRYPIQHFVTDKGAELLPHLKQ